MASSPYRPPCGHEECRETTCCTRPTQQLFITSDVPSDAALYMKVEPLKKCWVIGLPEEEPEECELVHFGHTHAIARNPDGYEVAHERHLVHLSKEAADDKRCELAVNARDELRVMLAELENKEYSLKQQKCALLRSIRIMDQAIRKLQDNG